LLTGCAAFYGPGETIALQDDMSKFELNLGTNQTILMEKLGAPQYVAFAESGYRYWDYCYEQDGNQLHIANREYNDGCNALRLFLDPKGNLIDFKKTSIRR
jgi:hypothetical protein